MITLRTLQAELAETRQRLAAIEERQIRFMRMWIATHLTSSTSTPTGKTAPTSTVTTSLLERILALLLRVPVLKHIVKLLPRLSGFIAERLAGYLWPLLVSGAMAGWAIALRYSEQLGAWIGNWWHPLLP